MELLLNLLWLTLMLPAIWIWRHAPTRVRHNYGRIQSCLLLICVLTLLFPVVSATDDLHPMRTEMEESSPLKRVVKHSSNGNSSASWLSNPAIFFARSVGDARICPDNEVSALVSPSSTVFPELLTHGQRDSRGPPSGLLG
jgi:hypothetical protein